MGHISQWSVAKQALSIMVIDLGYGKDHEPRNGDAPIRHQMMWYYCQKALRDDFETQLQWLEENREELKTGVPA